MIYAIKIQFLLFITYSFLGWCIELILKYIEYKRLINRGFLIGPWLPIYGWGATLITILLQKYSGDIIVLFILGLLICATLEYATSYVLEKVFRARWWDYSTKKYNINGRICLETMIPFGILAVLLINYINPFLLSIYSLISNNILDIVITIIMILYIIDNIISFNVLSIVKKDNDLLEKDNSEEMSKKVIEKIKNSGYLPKRLLFAYPNFKHIGIEINKKAKKAKEKMLMQKNNYINKQKKILNDYSRSLNKIEVEYKNKMNKIISAKNKKLLKISKIRGE